MYLKWVLTQLRLLAQYLYIYIYIYDIIDLINCFYIFEDIDLIDHIIFIILHLLRKSFDRSL